MRVLCCETCGLMALRLASIMEAAAEVVQHLSWDILVKELSGGKQKAMSGQQVGELFEKALVFANALLSGIDKTRLKPS